MAGGIDEVSGNRGKGKTGKFRLWTATPNRNFSSSVPGWVDHAPGGNFSCKRSALAQVGGVDEALNVGAGLYEESDLVLRLRTLGHRVWFEPRARLLHRAASTGGCRVEQDWPRYMYGLAHNRAIIIRRHLRPWHFPTALARLLILGLSYGRVARSLKPFTATLRGVRAGWQAAVKGPQSSALKAEECTIS